MREGEIVAKLKRINDSCIVMVHNDLDKAIVSLKNQMQKCGTLKTLRRRADFPTSQGRQRAKKRFAECRLKQKEKRKKVKF